MRKFFLGKNTPNIFTRILCNFGLLYFFYLFFWTLIIIIAFNFGQNLPKAENWNKLFLEIGVRYNILDIHMSYSIYLYSLLLICASFFIGILLVWRKKVKGYYFVIISTLASIFIPFVLLGYEFVKNECGWFEFLFSGLVITLFTIDYFLRRRLV